MAWRILLTFRLQPSQWIETFKTQVCFFAKKNQCKWAEKDWNGGDRVTSVERYVLTWYLSGSRGCCSSGGAAMNGFLRKAHKWDTFEWMMTEWEKSWNLLFLFLLCSACWFYIWAPVVWVNVLIFPPELRKLSNWTLSFLENLFLLSLCLKEKLLTQLGKWRRPSTQY